MNLSISNLRYIDTCHGCNYYFTIRNIYVPFFLWIVHISYLFSLKVLESAFPLNSTSGKDSKTISLLRQEAASSSSSKLTAASGITTNINFCSILSTPSNRSSDEHQHSLHVFHRLL